MYEEKYVDISAAHSHKEIFSALEIFNDNDTIYIYKLYL